MICRSSMATSPSLHPADVVLRLVESVGRRSDADFYVQLFRKLPKSAFAIVAPGASSLEAAAGLVVEHLRFLDHLGLHAPVVLGLFQPSQASFLAAQFIGSLREAGLTGDQYNADTPNLDAILLEDLNRGRTPVVCFSPEENLPQEARFERLGQWAATLASRKLVLVRAQGGMGPHKPGVLALGPDHNLPASEKGIPVINLRYDLEPLLQAQTLGQEEGQLLTSIQVAMQKANAQRDPCARGNSEPLLTSITSPTNLLHELFTVKGAGTLIKPGIEIQVHANYQQVNTDRMRQLLETTFEKKLDSHFFSTETSAVYVEPNYRGAAIVRPGNNAAFLTKFVVGRLAQGLGLGRDLWEVVSTHHPALYWRSRRDNPVNAWYESQCDGRTCTEQWIVYWRGISPDRIAAIVKSAEQQPIDFHSPAPAINKL